MLEPAGNVPFCGSKRDEEWTVQLLWWHSKSSHVPWFSLKEMLMTRPSMKKNLIYNSIGWKTTNVSWLRSIIWALGVQKIMLYCCSQEAREMGIYFILFFFLWFDFLKKIVCIVMLLVGNMQRLCTHQVQLKSWSLYHSNNISYNLRKKKDSGTV